MTAPAARTALFPVGPTAPLSFAPGSAERADIATMARTSASSAASGKSRSRTWTTCAPRASTWRT